MGRGMAVFIKRASKSKFLTVKATTERGMAAAARQDALKKKVRKTTKKDNLIKFLDYLEGGPSLGDYKKVAFWQGFDKSAARIKKLQGGIRLLMPSRNKAKAVAKKGPVNPFDLSSLMNNLQDDIGRLSGKPPKKALQHQRDMRRLAMRQTLLDSIVNNIAKTNNISKGKARDALGAELGKKLDGLLIGGTVARGKKGKRSYISVPAVKEMQRGGGANLREIIHHEGFHQKVPVLGHSEIAAPMYGGLKRKKGTYSPVGAVKSLGMLAKARPDRLLIEGAAAGGVGYGAKKGIDALRGQDKK